MQGLRHLNSKAIFSDRDSVLCAFIQARGTLNVLVKQGTNSLGANYLYAEFAVRGEFSKIFNSFLSSFSHVTGPPRFVLCVFREV